MKTRILKPKDSEAIHDRLTSKGWRQKGATDGNATTYTKKGREAVHTRGKHRSFLDFYKRGE